MVQCYRSPVIIHTKLLSACWRIFFYLIRLMDIILKLKSKKKKRTYGPETYQENCTKKDEGSLPSPYFIAVNKKNFTSNFHSLMNKLW